MVIPARRLVRVGGVDLHVVELGQATAGPPLLLLHGLCDSHLTWSKVAPVLAARRRVIMPDLPGHGLSGRPDASYALAWNASVMGAFLDALGLDEVDLVGHSYGGGVAQWMLLEHRARVRRVMLVSSGGLGRDVSVELRLASLGALERLGQPFLGVGTRVGLAAAGGRFEAGEVDEIAWMAARPGTARALRRTVRDVIDLRGQRRHFLDRAGEVDPLPPIALAWGDRDRVLPFHHAEQTAAILEGAPLSRYEGAGHFPHREAPARFAAELEAFLDAPEVPAPRLRRPVQVQVGYERLPGGLGRALAAVGRAVRALFRPRRLSPRITERSPGPAQPGSMAAHG
jgi:pimeloyl-ACP methyl ester carboxylesterase